MTKRVLVKKKCGRKFKYPEEDRLALPPGPAPDYAAAAEWHERAKHMRHVDGMSYREIAKETGYSMAVVYDAINPDFAKRRAEKAVERNRRRRRTDPDYMERVRNRMRTNAQHYRGSVPT